MHLSKAETKYKKTINDKGKGKHDKGSLALCQMLIKKPAMANAYCLVNNNGQKGSKSLVNLISKTQRCLYFYNMIKTTYILKQSE
jgi:hypothetical protein